MTLKTHFPIFKKSKIVYLDSAASTQKPKPVLDAMDKFYKTSYSNVHRGTCKLAETATAAYEKARLKVASFIGTKPNNIVFTKGATEAVNLVANGFSLTLKPGDEVLCSIAEHHAVFVPLQQACLRSGATFRTVNILPDGRIDISDLTGRLTRQTKLVAVTHISNVLGTVNPVEEVIAAAHVFGAKVLVDGAQSIAHMPLNVTEMNCDFFVFSGHKIYGPTGIGVLYGKTEALNALPPYQFGGDMIREVKVEKTTFADVPAKFEAGTPPIVEAVGLGTALDYVSNIGMDAIRDAEEKLTRLLVKDLKKIKNIEFLGAPDTKHGIVAFNIKGIHPADIAFALGKDNICVRVGHHCAMPLHACLGTTASLRVSFGLYSDKKDVKAFLKSLKKSLAFFK